MGTNPATIFLIAVGTWLPLILFIIGFIMALRILSQQNILQRYEWYWAKITGKLQTALISASTIAIILGIYSTWRTLQVWALRPIKRLAKKHHNTRMVGIPIPIHGLHHHNNNPFSNRRATINPSSHRCWPAHVSMETEISP